MKRPVLICLFALALVVGACSGETAEPIDLRATVPTTDAPTETTLGEAEQQITDDNEAQRQVAVGYAEQQCLEDPDLEEGYVQIVVPDTDEKVGEITADCAEVRGR